VWQNISQAKLSKLGTVWPAQLILKVKLYVCEAPKVLSKGGLGQYVLQTVLDLFFCHLQLRSLWPYFCPLHSKGYIIMGLGMLKPKVIRKTHPSPLPLLMLSHLDKDVFFPPLDRTVRIRGHKGSACKRPK